ncbi:MAG: hypothetical protein K5798_09935 [Nitrosopumilus sp.]|uniref:hypothetical protein n=1 Tax=Nitrosopumilus sp. TaxID=2024843 RepID=UPI00242CDEDF|nr:hypothetical protein [Nitrosopumilus sp.]MCV0367564.1 hypothetical protein [Nitrosopumilus sp.]
MKKSLIIPILILCIVSVSVSILTTSFYIKEPSKVAGFSAYDKIDSIHDVQMIPGYEHVIEPTYVPEEFDIGPLIFRGKSDEHHSLHLYYGSTGDSYEEMKSAGFQITFTDRPDPLWEEHIGDIYENYNTVNNVTVVHMPHGVFYHGEPQPISVKSNYITDFDELEKILRSAIDNDINNKWKEYDSSVSQCLSFFHCDASEKNFEQCISGKKDGITIEQLCFDSKVTTESGCTTIEFPDDTSVIRCR